MLAAPLKSLHPTESHEADVLQGPDTTTQASAPGVVEEEEQITVKKAFTFAGQRTEEEKQIPRSALEQYLSEGWKAADPAVEEQVEDSKGPEVPDDQPKIRRPLRRPLRFDPNPTGFVRALAPEHQLSWPRKATSATLAQQESAAPLEATKAKPEKAQKLNVVDKSRLDWTGFVDKEGIAEELNKHGKTKEAYLGRMDFLAGVEARREEERKRMKTAATT